MKIEKVNLPEEICATVGLKAIKMDRLNQVVLVAGKNGAGKSRLLHTINQNIKNALNTNEILSTIDNINKWENSIKMFEGSVKNLELKLKEKNLSKEKIDSYNSLLRDDKRSLENYSNSVDVEKIKLIQASYFKFDPDLDKNSTISFVPKSITLLDSYILNQQDIDNKANIIYTLGTLNIANGTIPAIEKIQRNWVNINTTTIDDLNVTKVEKEKINSDYSRLKDYIKLFLNTDLKRTKEGYPEIFKKRIGEAQLSDGQKILLQFCIALFAQEASLENLIIFMDEPENHLHPAALIEVLDKIIPHIKNGQLWIATHSINVLAHFDPSNIWYIDDGEVSYAGNVPRKVMEGLLGTEEEIEKLSNFLSLPAHMASTNFSFESLFYPDVKITGADDPQVAQIFDIIKNRAKVADKLKILDFGMGKGRFISTIFENERLRESNLADWLDFYGYDKFTENKDLCLKILEDLYGNSNNRYFNDTKDLLAKHDEKTFDFIVMCNVFHEINPSDWINLFTSVTNPFKLLKDEGYLLIIEDQFLAVGEKAHANGFLVYDELEFKKLFKITTTDKYQSTDYRKDGRLKSHHIPKNCLPRIDINSKKESLEYLIQNSKDKIKEIRMNKEPTFKNGKLHGFWAMQLANASLALEEL
jgi:ABC-type cobalamin/Fe3+-siderophores transport system ATPase subunit